MNKDSTQKYIYLKTISYLLLTTIILFFLIPLVMIDSSPDDYSLITWQTFLYIGLFYSLIFLLLFFTFFIISWYFNIINLANKIILFLFSYITLSGLIFPIAVSSGMVNPLTIELNKYHFSIVITLSILTVIGLNYKTKYSVFCFYFILIIFSFLSLLPIVFNFLYIDKNFKLKQAANLSKFNNIIILSLDGLPGDLTYQLINHNQYLKNKFKDFIYFENILASSPATNASITGELFGNQPFKKLANTQIEINGKLNKDLLLINSSKFDTYTYYQAYNKFNKNKNTHLNIGDLSGSKLDYRKFSATIDLYKYLIVRVGGGSLLNFFYFISNYTLIFQQKIIMILLSTHSSIYNDFLIKIDKSPEWNKANLLSIIDLKNYINHLFAGNNHATARYMHFTFTHFPVTFNDSCNYKADDINWYLSHQNKEGLATETKCGLKMYATLIDKLKELKIYDNSLIILKSDHGQPVNYFNKIPDSYKINNNLYWGFNRYKPFLMIKNYHQKQRHLINQKEIVLIDDLAKTLCLRTQYLDDCNQLPGINLLQPIIKNLQRQVYIYVPKNEKSDFTIDTHKEITLSLIDGTTIPKLFNHAKEAGLIKLNH